MQSITYNSLSGTIKENSNSWTSYISSARYIEIEKILIRFIIIAFIINSLSGIYFIKKIYLDGIVSLNVAEASFSIPKVYASIEAPASPSLESFLDILKSNGFNATARLNVDRPLFGVEGRLITLGNDSLETFEYPDNKTALEEFARISNEYSKSAWSKSYKDQIHLFVNDNVGVYYLGTNEKIIEALEETSSPFPLTKLF